MRLTENERAALCLAFVMLAAAAILFLLLVSGCARTVVAPAVKASRASWDGTNQNSGFIGFAPDGRGIITTNARARYDLLISAYGARFVPPLQVDAGLTATSSNAWLIDQQHLADFMEMQRWRRAGNTNQ